MTQQREIVILQQDCSAYMVPSGARIMLHAGTEVTITQSLGDSYTVNVYGNLARIESRDSAALGKEPVDPLLDLSPDATMDEKVDALLSQVYDPEIPVDIYELGLIYDVQINEEDFAEVTMTLTSPACPVAGTLPPEVQQKIKDGVEALSGVSVEIVWDPPWSVDMMSEGAKLELGMM